MPWRGFVFAASLWSHLNVLTFSPLTGGCSESLGAFWFFFKQHRGTRSNAMKRFCVCSLWSHLTERFDVFPPLTGGCSEGLGAFWFFFKQHSPDEKKSTKVGVGPSSPALLGFQSRRGPREIKCDQQWSVHCPFYKPWFWKTKTNKKKTS